MAHLQFVIVRRLNTVVDAGDKDPTIWCYQLAHENDQGGHRLVDSSTVNPRMQVSPWTGYRDLVVGNTTKAICQAGCSGIQPVVIRLRPASTREIILGRREMPTMHTASTPWK